MKACIDCEHIERIHLEWCCGLELVKKVEVASGYHHEGVKCVHKNPKQECVKWKKWRMQNETT